MRFSDFSDSADRLLGAVAGAAAPGRVVACTQGFAALPAFARDSQGQDLYLPIQLDADSDLFRRGGDAAFRCDCGGTLVRGSVAGGVRGVFRLLSGFCETA